MRGSASGRLVLRDVVVPADAILVRRLATEPDPRGAAPGAWFGIAVAATYLGVGEGARANVARWALDRRPGDGKTSVADVPSVQLRLGRLDVELRAARIVVLDVARRWDEAIDRGDAAGLAAAAGDVPLAKLVATRAAVTATDEALRIAGGPDSCPVGSSVRSASPCRSHQPAARGRGTDRVRPRHRRRPSIVMATRPEAGPNPAAFHYGPGHMIVHANPPFVEVFGAGVLGQPAREALLGLPPKAFELMDLVLSTGKPGACRIDTADGPRRLVVAPRKDPRRARPMASPPISSRTSRAERPGRPAPRGDAAGLSGLRWRGDAVRLARLGVLARCDDEPARTGSGVDPARPGLARAEDEVHQLEGLGRQAEERFAGGLAEDAGPEDLDEGRVGVDDHVPRAVMERSRVRTGVRSCGHHVRARSTMARPNPVSATSSSGGLMRPARASRNARSRRPDRKPGPPAIRNASSVAFTAA